MKEQLDLVKILKDCPSGMELDCTMYDNVTFVEVCKDTNTLYPIYCITTDENGNRSGCSFTKNGYASPRESSKCVIFPKGKTTWEGFHRPFESGDILYVDCNTDGEDYEEFQYIFILKEINGDEIHCYCCIDNADGSKRFETCWLTDMTYTPRFASQIEKDKLFDAIKSHGYKWNAKEKKLEQLIVPKFKVGDKVVKKGCNIPVLISEINDGNYYSITENSIGSFKIKEQDNWELVPNKFDPKTLKPFDKVLVKQYNEHWHIQFFETIHEYNKKYPFVCLGGKIYSYCIPYAGNEHLLDTMNEPFEFYRYWEN